MPLWAFMGRPLMGRTQRFAEPPEKLTFEELVKQISKLTTEERETYLALDKYYLNKTELKENGHFDEFKQMWIENQYQKHLKHSKT